LGSLQAQVETLGGQIVAVAVTPTYSQMAFGERLGATFPMLSDWDTQVCAAYGVRYASWKGHAHLAKRAVFVIGQDRVIRHRWSTDDAEELPDLKPALRTIETLM